ncbi:hypothetical protein ACHAXH_001621 [Discostella pseudostelligera]
MMMHAHTFQLLPTTLVLLYLHAIFVALPVKVHAFINPSYLSSINSNNNHDGARHLLSPPQRRRRQQLQSAIWSRTSTDDTTKSDRLRVVVVGGGWAGYSFCESISHNNIIHGENNNKEVDILLLDASNQARGGLAGGYRSSKTDRPVEAGIHGFWREYRNTFDIMNGIEGVNVNKVLGEYSPSVLWSKNGKVATAPVLLQGEENAIATCNQPILSTLNDLSEESIRRYVAALLPPPLDLPILAKLDNKKSKTSNVNDSDKLSTIDLVSGTGLLGAWADFEQESRTSWENYDTYPASLLFKKSGITPSLFEELVSPLLHVLPMCPAYDCSAAAALSCFHVFALQSRGAFDVRWCRGSISEKIFDPWKTQLESRGVVIRGGARVASITKSSETGKFSIDICSMSGDVSDTIESDVVVLAVGATAAGKLASASPAMSSLPATANFDKLRHHLRGRSTISQAKFICNN